MKAASACFAAILVAVSLPLAGAVQAEEALRVRTISVAHQDLDLSSEADARTLLQRIKRAGQQACRLNGEMMLSRQAQECRRDAVATAVHRVKAPTLAAALDRDVIASLAAGG
ncbi:MAG TPA: UrcA family protein [Caulobacteraceae bacterium]|jgi:UrcA family protein